MGILGKIKNMFSNDKVEVSSEQAARTDFQFQRKKSEEKVAQEEEMPRYLLAKKMREEKDMEQPIIKRKRF